MLRSAAAWYRALVKTVKSKYGTPIAYARSGNGPPFVLVHGTTADHTRWAPLLPRLEGRFTVYAFDRRGRGGSGDAPVYAIEREFEDVAAVVDSIAGPVNVLAHSYGALCTMEALLRTGQVGRVVLYEPPLPIGIAIFPPGSVEKLEALLAAGDRAAVVEGFFRDIVKMPAGELAMLKSLPNWPERVAAAHTIPREMRADEAYRFDAKRFAALRVPTLFLLGGDSPQFLKQATEAAHRAIPGSRIVVMPGQQHTAMNTAPDLFLREVLGFLGG